jgi:hypothetical protein
MPVLQVKLQMARQYINKNTLICVCELGSKSPMEAWINEVAIAICVLKISIIHSVAFGTTAAISNTDHMKNTPQSPACAPQIEEQYRWQSCTLLAKDMSDIDAFKSRMHAKNDEN